MTKMRWDKDRYRDKPIRTIKDEKDRMGGDAAANFLAKQTKVSSGVSVTQRNGMWIVLQNGQVAGEFETSAAAWRFVDKHDRRRSWSRSKTALRNDAHYFAPMKK